MNRTFFFPVSESTQTGEVRRLAMQLAGELGLDETEKGKAGIVATEVATNLHKHSKDGMVLIRPLIQEEKKGIEILSLDRGPGIADVNRSLQDGYSTTGTAGNGLGSIRRLSSVFDLYSSPQGTILLSQIWAEDKTPALQWGAICVPYPGEKICGDAWSFRKNETGFTVMVADGLGHGLQAAEASAEAVRIFQEYRTDNPAASLQRMHQAMRSTRGAALMIVEFSASNELVCSGVGNIAGHILEGRGTRSMVSHNGTIGHQATKFQEFKYPWSPHGLLIMHSDGMLNRWKLDAYPGIQGRHPSLIAALLFRDFRRDHDDSTVLVLRHPGPPT